MAGLARTDHRSGGWIHYKFYLVPDSSPTESNGIPVLYAAHPKQCRGGQPDSRDGFRRAQPGSGRAPARESKFSGSDRRDRAASSRASPACTHAAQLSALRPGWHDMVLPVLLLHDGREPNGPLCLLQLDAAHGQHHYLQQPLGNRIQGVARRGQPRGITARSGIVSPGRIDCDCRLRQLLGTDDNRALAAKEKVTQTVRWRLLSNERLPNDWSLSTTAPSLSRLDPKPHGYTPSPPV